MVAQMRRYFVRQAEAVVGRMKKSFRPDETRAALADIRSRGGDPLELDVIMFDAGEWNAALEELGLQEMLDTFPQAWKMAVAEVDGTSAFNMTKEAVRQTMRTSLDKLVGVNDETRSQLMDTLLEGLDAEEPLDNLVNRVLDVFREATTTRAQRIARTTTTQSINASQLQAWQTEKVGKKMWLTSRDEKVRDAHTAVDGQTVKMSDSFVVAGENLAYPGDPEGSAGNIIQCRCFMIPVLEKK